MERGSPSQTVCVRLWEGNYIGWALRGLPVRGKRLIYYLFNTHLEGITR